MNSIRLSVLSLEERTLASATPLVAPSVPSVTRAAAASPSPQQEWQKQLKVIRTQFDVPALAGGTINSSITTVAATGVRERGKTVSVQQDDQFHLGSNGKAMTSTLAAILVERGYLRWTTTLGEMFPQQRNSMNPAYRDVTLEQLLNHRGGFDDANVTPELAEKIQSYKGSTWIGRKMFLVETLKTPPGKAGEFSYSNVGYTLAATMMEAATHNTYEWLMTK